ncbi:glycerol-3-phosphate dehydrogenase [Oxalobacteraceae bacterium GrIS 2.11]
MRDQVDVLVVGGGINGVGIARDAAGRGLSVMLCEKDDLAAHTSSASTKLIHGGLRYLEYYEFRLVRKALQEREVLLRAAPHIINPLRFVMPHVAHLRPAWLIRLGLFLYDNLSTRNILFGSRSINFKSHVSGRPLQDSFSKGFVYSDAWVDDARLVVLNAMDAKQLGATILTRTKLISAHQENDGWRVTMQNRQQEIISIFARCIVNATGPWVSSFLEHQIHSATPQTHNEIRLIKGSHIVTKKLFDHHYAYIFQNPDKRIIFAIPYMDQYTLIGTTDLEFNDDPNQVQISAGEISYLCDSINTYFKQRISPADVVWHYAGVRPLVGEEDTGNPSAVTRDYHLKLDERYGKAILLSVFGGKITTFRRLAEEALDMLTPLLGSDKPAWTAKATLPGGDIPRGNFDAFLIETQRRYPWLAPELSKRYAHQYGSRITQLLGAASAMADLGEELCAGLFECEAQYLVEHEWALCSEDILWRRTKLGLAATTESVARLDAWLEKKILTTE